MSNRPPVVLRGQLGWGNPGCNSRHCSFDTYGPGGRWGDTSPAGDLLADALHREGADEADTLVVVAIPLRQPEHDAVLAAVEAAIQAALSGASGGEG